MSEARLPSGLWVRAVLRAWLAAGRFGAVLHRGDPDAGGIAAVLDAGGAGARIVTLTRDLDGRPAWLPALDGRLAEAAEVRTYIDRARARDPDLWVVEFEGTGGANPFEGRVL